MRVIAVSAPLRRSPAPDAPLETEALHGESVTVYDEEGEWAWAQLDLDQYVGYLPLTALGAPLSPTHRIAALRTHGYPGPSVKLPPHSALSLGARLTVVRQEGDFAVSEAGLHLWSRHLADAHSREPDTVAVAERFLETPYLWGGRTSEGIDCSGLVQTALTAAGVAAPRDSDMMEAGLGEPIGVDDSEASARARRSRVLEGPRRHHARFRHAHSRQRLAHEGRQRTAHGSAEPDRRQRRRARDERETVGAGVDGLGSSPSAADRGYKPTSCQRRPGRQSGC